MFSRHYFGAAYFAPRYFPGEAVGGPPPASGHDGFSRIIQEGLI